MLQGSGVPVGIDKISNQLPKVRDHTIKLPGYQIFSVSVFRINEKSIPRIYSSSTTLKTTAEPPKVQQLQKRLAELETRKDPTLQRVPADGCHAYPVPAEPPKLP